MKDKEARKRLDELSPDLKSLSIEFCPKCKHITLAKTEIVEAWYFLSPSNKRINAPFPDKLEYICLTCGVHWEIVKTDMSVIKKK